MPGIFGVSFLDIIYLDIPFASLFIELIPMTVLIFLFFAEKTRTTKISAV